MLAEERSPSDLLGCYTNERASFFMSTIVLAGIKEGKKRASLRISKNSFSLSFTAGYLLSIKIQLNASL